MQELFLAGDRDGAVKAVPDELCDGIALCGPLERIKERLELWRASPVTTLVLGGVSDPDHHERPRRHDSRPLTWRSSTCWSGTQRPRILLITEGW